MWGVIAAVVPMHWISSRKAAFKFKLYRCSTTIRQVVPIMIICHVRKAGGSSNNIMNWLSRGDLQRLLKKLLKINLLFPVATNESMSSAVKKWNSFFNVTVTVTQKLYDAASKNVKKS